MTSRHRFLRLLLGALLFLFLVVSSSSTRAGGRQPVIVIVASGSTVKNVTKAELRRLFLAQTDNINGQRAVPFNHPPATDLRTRFDDKVLGMSASEVGRYWIDRKIRGESGAPRPVPSPDLLKRVVAQLPGAVAYLSAEQIDSSVHIVTIDGKGPDSPDYPLK